MAALLIEIKQRVDTLKSEGYTEMDANEIANYEAIYKSILSKRRLEAPATIS